MAKKKTVSTKKPQAESKSKTPTVVEAYLSDFVENNPHAKITSNKTSLTVQKPWGADDVSLKFPIKDHQFLKVLNGLTINPRFDAIIHNDSNTIEVFAGYFQKDERFNPILDRQFTFHFDGVACDCTFAEPTKHCLELAKRSEHTPRNYMQATATQLDMYKDAQNLENLPEAASQYFETRVARNFFVKLNKPVAEVCLDQLMRHLNFMMDYYDRRTPEVHIRTDDSGNQMADKTSIRFVEDEFPKELVVTPKDEIVLQLLEVARHSPPRHGFVYYYQVLEYVGHYYVDDKIKKELRLILRDPTIVNCDDRKLGEMFSLLTERHRDDKQKMAQMIKECVNSKLIWNEIANDMEFFAKPHEFDGGFTLDAIVSQNQTYESWETKGMQTLFEQLRGVRNCLVHAREKRENKVVLPTTSNNARIRHLIPVISRIASQIAINS